jgi:hypothetical protein
MATSNTKPAEQAEVDPFSDPGSGGSYPTMKMLNGRLLLIRPTVLEKGLPNTLQPGTFRDRITADVVVLDGDDITEIVNDDGDVTAELDEPLVPPFKLEDMYISQSKLISEIKSKVADKGLVIGRLARLKPLKAGQKGAWSLQVATDADRAVGRAYLASVDPFA